MILEALHFIGVFRNPSEIVRQQKVDVDAVSGATSSSQVIKKAVENALEQTSMDKMK